MRTYDIIDSGPKNRFMANGRIVSNSGRLWQPHNLPRPNLKQEVIEFGIETLKANCADLFFDNVMEVASNAIRGCIVAPAGKKLVVSDLASIEGRVLPWLAGEQWKLDAYLAYDLGIGPDMYTLAYARAFRIPLAEVTKEQRAVGKVMELMLGFGGSTGAFITGAAAYKIDLKKMAEGLLPEFLPTIREKAENSWDWAVENKRTYDLNKNIYLVCRGLTEMWRLAHPKIVTFWSGLETMAKVAIENKGKEYQVGKIKFIREGSWLRAILPSGRSLCYAAPRIAEDKDGEHLSYAGNNQYSRKWGRLRTYGGRWAENVTQAVARDIMTANMPRVEAAGYEIVSTIHDEIITEVPDSDNFSAVELSALLATNPVWAKGLPLAAAGFETYRYRKND